MNHTATIRDPPHPSGSSSSCRSKKSPPVGGRTGSLPCPGRRSGICGAPCSRSSMQSLRCRFSTVPRRRWWNSCRTSCAYSTRSRLFPRRLSQCPKSCPVMSLCEPLFAKRSWRNNWWKCRRSYPSSSLQRTVEHNVAIPVPGGGGRLASLQGFLPGQSSTAPQFSKERLSERIVEQIVDIPGGGLQGFRLVQGSPASSSSVSPAGSDDYANERGATQKKVRKSPGTRVRECPGTSAHPR